MNDTAAAPAATRELLTAATDAIHQALLADLGREGGFCHQAQTALSMLLTRLGIEHLCADGYCPDLHDEPVRHVWIVAAGLNLDPTRGQFDRGPRVTPVGQDELYDNREDLAPPHLVGPSWDLEHLDFIFPSLHAVRACVRSWRPPAAP